MLECIRLILRFQLPVGKLSTKPVICCVSGICKSIGFELALKCDIRVLEDNVKLGLYDSQLYMPLINGGPQRLSELIGESGAADLVVSKRELNVNEARNYSISNYITTEGGGKKLVTEHFSRFFNLFILGLGRSLSTAVNISTQAPSILKYNLKAISQRNIAFDDAIFDELKSNFERLHFNPECE